MQATALGVGRVRNEDGFVMIPERRAFAVAAGQGGVTSGEDTTACTLDAFARVYREGGTGIDGVADTERRWDGLSHAVHVSNRALVEMVAGNDRYQGASAAFLSLEVDVVAHMAAFAWVGDAVGLRLRDGHLELVTTPHTLMNDQLAAGLVTREQADTSRLRNIVTRVLGYQATVAVDIVAMDVHDGDLLLLATNGAWQSEADEIIAATLRRFVRERGRSTMPAEAAKALIALLNPASSDNRTVIVIDCV